MELPDAFDKFIDEISLGVRPDDRIQSAVTAVTDVIVKAYGLNPADVFMQGSYPNGTAVAPVGDDPEYDVDLVAVCADGDASATKALDDLEEKIRSHGTYDGMADDQGKQPAPCVRLRYAPDDTGKFHVDIVPARRPETGAPLEVPRRDEGWHDSDPEGYTKWCVDQGLRFERTVKMLKRWRDVNQTAAASIKSIVLQVLAGEHLDPSAGDAEALLKTLAGIQDALADHPNAPPEVKNPVSTLDEDLAARWTPSSYRDFLTALDDAVDLAQRAYDAADETTSRKLWNELLGDDFPKDPDGGGNTRAMPPVPPVGAESGPRVPRGRVRHG